MTIGVECGSRIVPVGPPASLKLNLDLDDPSDQNHISPDPAPGPSDQSVSGDSSVQKTAPATKQTQKHMKLSLWDTAGQETYKSITRSYFRGASGALLVFDITRPATFKSVTQWLQDLRHIADEDIIVVLVGNKSDLVSPNSASKPDAPIVTREEAEAWCKENDVSQYVETSAKSGEGVERAFIEVAERIYRNIEKGKYDLNDRRSGVKGYGITRTTARAHGSNNVNLHMSNALNGNRSSWTSDCC